MTAQAPDIIVIDGEAFRLFSNPLESYFNEDNPRPNFGVVCTANWRGYVATWEISEDTLYLVNLSSSGSRSTDFSIATLFPGSPKKVKAEWFSGELRVPGGKCIHYVHLGYFSVYEKELIIEVEKGMVKSRRIFDNKKRFKRKGDLERYVVTEAMNLFSQWKQPDFNKLIATLQAPAGKKPEEEKKINDKQLKLFDSQTPDPPKRRKRNKVLQSEADKRSDRSKYSC